MFHWYRKAGVCFAYLADVPASVDSLEAKSLFSRSKWLTRGWTLQELLAPSEVIFLANDWTEFASKTKSVSLIAEITGIPLDFLLGEDLEHASVAMRMSWASNRVTTKAEDIAYCLLGIFDIQMPLMYGEREAGAFRRLQQEILKTSDDQSIFAWTTEDVHTPLCNASARQTFSLLAHSPASFKGSHNIIEAEAPVVSGYLDGIRTPTVFNNKGLHLSLPIIQKRERRVLAILNCSDFGKEGGERIAIWLRDVSTNGGRYVRVERQKLERIPMSAILKSATYSSISATKGDVEDLDKTKGSTPIQRVVVGPAPTFDSLRPVVMTRLSGSWRRVGRHLSNRAIETPMSEERTPLIAARLIGEPSEDITIAERLIFQPFSQLTSGLWKCFGRR